MAGRRGRILRVPAFGGTVGIAPGSGDGGSYEPAEQDSALHFINCEFGKEETNTWRSREDAQFDGCIFGVMPGLQIPNG